MENNHTENGKNGNDDDEVIVESTTNIITTVADSTTNIPDHSINGDTNGNEITSNGHNEQDGTTVIHEITEDEAALYDRQIRLWGVEAQRRLLNSRVLLVNMKGLGGEIAKNLVLAGINSITILDSSEVTEHDIKINFLIDRNGLGKNRAQSCVYSLQILNPLVKVNADVESIELKDSSYFSKNNFDIVCVLTNDNYDQLVKIDEMCRKNSVYFLCGYVFGIHGYMFVDLNNYKYICEVPKILEDESEGVSINEKLKRRAEARKTEKEVVLIEKETQFVDYSKFIQSYKQFFKNLTPKKAKRLSKAYFVTMIVFLFREKYKRDLIEDSDAQLFLELKKEFFSENNLDQTLLDDSYAEQVIGEACPVNAILGGIIAQEIIKSISQNKEPIENLFVFDGEALSGIVEKVGC